MNLPILWKGAFIMTEKDARELIDGLTADELINLYGYVSELIHSRGQELPPPDQDPGEEK